MSVFCSSTSVLFALILKFAPGIRFKTRENEVTALVTWQISARVGKMCILKDIIVGILLSITYVL